MKMQRSLLLSLVFSLLLPVTTTTAFGMKYKQDYSSRPGHYGDVLAAILRCFTGFFWQTDDLDLSENREGTLYDTEETNVLPVDPLAVLNSEIWSLINFLAEQNKITPAHESCFLKPQNIDPLDFYKRILKAYAPFQNSIELYVEALADLAEANLKFTIERCLFVECLNLSEVSPLEEVELDKIVETLTEGDVSYFVSLRKKMSSAVKKEPLWGEIRNSSLQEKRTQTFHDIFLAFKEEIRKAKYERRTHYRWFILFSDQLAVLRSKLLYRAVYDTNTGTIQYITIVDRRAKFPDFSEQKYFVNHDRQDRVSSLPALISLFPKIFIFPFPFPLGAGDFLRFSMGNQLLWPAGEVFRPVFADGYCLCPRLFWSHDIHDHLGLLMAPVLSPTKVFKGTPYGQTTSEQLADIMFQSQNFLNFFLLLQDEISSMLSKISDEDTKTIYTFFAFHDFHEDVKTAERRINSIVGRETPDDFSHNHFMDYKYYRSLYPLSKQALSDDELKDYLTQARFEYNAFLKKKLSPQINVYIEKYFKSYVFYGINSFAYCAEKLEYCLGNEYDYSLTFIVSNPNRWENEGPDIVSAITYLPENRTMEADDFKQICKEAKLLYESNKDKRLIPNPENKTKI